MAIHETPQPPAAPEVRPAILPPERSRGRNLSRAIAGMALAVIVAVTAAATELSLDLWGRHAIYSRRLAQARMRLDQTNLADQRAISLAAKARLQSQRFNDLDTLLLAPDLQLIRVTGVAPAPSAVILFSPARGRALLTITGLSKLLPGRHYQLASLDRHGAAHPLMQFDVVNDPTLIDLPDLAIVLTPTSRLTIISLLP